MEETSRIRHPRANEGPEDGVMMDAQCVRNTFHGNRVKPHGPHKAHITASVELGVFSIRDMEANVMLTVALQDAMAAIKEATGRAHSLETAADGGAQYADQPVLAPAT